jgi:hypothetical protein
MRRYLKIHKAHKPRGRNKKVLEKPEETPEEKPEEKPEETPEEKPEDVTEEMNEEKPEDVTEEMNEETPEEESDVYDDESDIDSIFDDFITRDDFDEFTLNFTNTLHVLSESVRELRVEVQENLDCMKSEIKEIDCESKHIECIQSEIKQIDKVLENIILPPKEPPHVISTSRTNMNLRKMFHLE